jgi:hypothetical protein
MDDLETIIRAAFRKNPRIHSMSFGVCTAHRSYGNFATLRDSKGNTVHTCEAADAIDAIRTVCGKATADETVTLPGVMPGMVTR